MLDIELLVEARQGGDVFYAFRDAADLILPAAASGHNLLHAKNMRIEVVFRIGDAHEVENSLDACRGKNRTRTQTAAFRNACDFRMHDETAAKTFQNGRQIAAALRKNAAGQQGGLLQRERIVGITRKLKRRKCIELAMDIHVTAVEDHFQFIDTLQADFDRTLSIEKNGRVEDGAAVFIAIRRRIAPATAPIDTERKLHDMTLLRDAARIIIFKVVQRAVQDVLLNRAEAFGRLLISTDAIQRRADVIVETHGFAEIGDLKMLFKPRRLDSRQCFFLEDAFDFAGGAFGADCFRDTVHANEFAHAARPSDNRLRIGIVKS